MERWAGYMISHVVFDEMFKIVYLHDTVKYYDNLDHIGCISEVC